MKNCGRCKEIKPLDEFYIRRRGRNVQHQSWCKDCCYKRDQRDTGRTCRLKAQYGITPDQFDQMLSSQQGACAICGATTYAPGDVRRLAVDHDHETGRVRGLLCMKCNSGLGAFNDDIDLIKMAVTYLAYDPSTSHTS